MAIHASYLEAQTNFAKLWEDVVRNQEIVIIRKGEAEDVVLISALELSSLAETVHLVRSSKNAERLLTALKRAQARTVPPQTLDELRQEVGLAQEEE
mgnify:FL=1